MKRHRLTLDALPVSSTVRALNPDLFPRDAHGLVLTLAGFTPTSPNRLNGKHWSALTREKKRARFALARALLDAGITHPLKAPKGSRWELRITVTRAHPLDPDNAVAACKWLIDAIVKTGLIPGDDFDTLTPICDQVRLAKGEGEEGTVVIFRRTAQGGCRGTGETPSRPHL